MISSDAIERRNRTANSCIFIFPDSKSSTFAFVVPRRMDMKSAWVCLVVVLLFCSVAGRSWWSESVVVVVVKDSAQGQLVRSSKKRFAVCKLQRKRQHVAPAPVTNGFRRRPSAVSSLLEPHLAREMFLCEGSTDQPTLARVRLICDPKTTTTKMSYGGYHMRCECEVFCDRSPE